MIGFIGSSWAFSRDRFAVYCQTKSPLNVYKYIHVSFEGVLPSHEAQLDSVLSSWLPLSSFTVGFDLKLLPSATYLHATYTTTPKTYCWKLYISLPIDAHDTCNTHSAKKCINEDIYNFEHYTRSVDEIRRLWLLYFHERNKTTTILMLWPFQRYLLLTILFGPLVLEWFATQNITWWLSPR